MDLSEIDSDYNDSYVKLLDEFKESLRGEGDKKKATKDFKKKLHKLIEDRNKKCKKYIENNKQKILGLERKPLKKEKKTEPYKSYNFSFERTFFERLNLRLSLFYFKVKLSLTSFWRHILPFNLRFILFRLVYLVAGFFSDIFGVFKMIYRRILRYTSKRFTRTKAIIMKFVRVVKKIILWIMEKKKAWDEYRKKKKEEKQKKKEAEEKARKEAEEKKEDGEDKKEDKENGEGGDEEKSEGKKEDPKEEKKEDVESGKIEEKNEKKKVG